MRNLEYSTMYKTGKKYAFDGYRNNHPYHISVYKDVSPNSIISIRKLMQLKHKHLRQFRDMFDVEPAPIPM